MSSRGSSSRKPRGGGTAAGPSRWISPLYGLSHFVPQRLRDASWVEKIFLAHLTEHPDYALAVPTPDHFIPLLYLAGLAAAEGAAASPLLREYVVRQGLCDYVTAHSPERYAVREVCELLIGLLGSFETIVTSRVAWDRDYAAYFTAREAVATEFVDQRANL